MSRNGYIDKTDCRRALPSGLLTAIGQFNSGRYYECHETLEELWLGEKGEIRKLYQGILQVGGGLYHLQRGNEAGAATLLARGTELLRPFSPFCLGVDVERLFREAVKVRAVLNTLGLSRTRALEARLFPRIRVIGD